MVGDPPPPPAEQPAEQQAAAGAVGGGGGAGEAAVEAVAAGAAATAATAPTHVLNQERFNVFNEGLLFYATYSLLLLLALMVVVGELRLTKRLPTLLFLPPCLLLPLLLCCFIASIPCKALVKPNSTLVPGYTYLPGVQNFRLPLFFIPLIYTHLLPPHPTLIAQLIDTSCRKLLLKELKMDTGDGAQVNISWLCQWQCQKWWF